MKLANNLRPPRLIANARRVTTGYLLETEKRLSLLNGAPL